MTEHPQGAYCPKCNPQRPQVIQGERRVIEGRAFVAMRLEATLASAAAIAMTPTAQVKRESFVQLACDAYDRARQGFDARVETELLRIEMSLASGNTNDDNKGDPS